MLSCYRPAPTPCRGRVVGPHSPRPTACDAGHDRNLATIRNRAPAATYIYSRAVQDRLDEVLGVDGWQDDYQCLPDGPVVCRLRCRIGGEWLTNVDVGGPSERPGTGDRVRD
jgi:hypothetical protein